MRTNLILPVSLLAVMALVGCDAMEQLAPSEEPDTEEASEVSTEEASDADELADPFATDTGEGQDEAPGDEATSGDSTPSDGDTAPAETGDGASSDEFGNVELTLETVSVVTWDEHDDAFNYALILDGNELDTTFSPPRLMVDHTVPLDGMTVEAREIGGDVLEEQDASLGEAEHLVVRWDDGAVTYPYVGFSVSGYGNAASSATPPFVIEHDPADVERVLFGPGVTVEEETEEGVTMTTSSPFDFGTDDVVGPHVELPLP